MSMAIRGIRRLRQIAVVRLLASALVEGDVSEER